MINFKASLCRLSVAILLVQCLTSIGLLSSPYLVRVTKLIQESSASSVGRIKTRRSSSVAMATHSGSDRSLYSSIGASILSTRSLYRCTATVSWCSPTGLFVCLFVCVCLWLNGTSAPIRLLVPGIVQTISYCYCPRGTRLLQFTMISGHPMIIQLMATEGDSN